MSCTVVEGETTDKLSVGGGPVLHLHNLNHVEVGLGRGLVDGEHGIHDIRGKLSGEARVELGSEGGPGDVAE